MRLILFLCVLLTMACADAGRKNSLLGVWKTTNVKEIQERQLLQNRRHVLMEWQTWYFRTDKSGEFVTKYVEPTIVKENPMPLTFNYGVTFKGADLDELDTIEYVIYSKNGHVSTETYKVVSFDGNEITAELILGDGEEMPKGIFQRLERVR